MNIIVGAYAASPAHAVWRPKLEKEYFSALADIVGLGGFELPWINGLHPHDETWLLTHLPPHLDIVLTDIGATVQRLAADSRFGLASLDESGRRAALIQTQRVRDGVHRLNQAAGRRVVTAVELHSAPLAKDGHASALAKSLGVIATWDWAGASLLIEHCDASVEGQRAEKGYLRLEDELTAIATSGQDVGISINWGRSAIELRDANQVTEHVRTASEAGSLRAIVFSGAANEPSLFGGPWEDAHLPLAPSERFPRGEPTSLLTEERLSRTLAVAGNLDWVGLKFGWRPPGSPVSDRVSMIADGVRVVQDATRQPLSQ